jgi:hypothetical protein
MGSKFCVLKYTGRFLNASTKKTGSSGDSKESRKSFLFNIKGRNKLTLSMHILRHRHNSNKQ